MKKISTLFKKDPNDLSRVIDEINPGCEWVLTNGIPTRKYDGIACAIIDGNLYKRRDVKKGKQVPHGAIPCQEPDAITGHYHDFKAPEHVVCGKTDFVNDSASFPELKELRQAVMNGDYDESPDEDDKADMRRDMPASMWPMLGLNPSN